MNVRKKHPQIGDVYSVQMPNGKWGALAVLREVENSYLVYTTSYYDVVPPMFSDSRLSSFYYRDEMYSQAPMPQIYWLDGRPGGNYEWIGRLDLAGDTEGQESKTYSGTWKTYLPMHLVYDEENELEKLNGNQEKSVPLNELRNSVPPVKELDDTDFWGFIDHLNFQKEYPANDLIDFLCSSSVETICAFEETLARKLFLLDTPEHAGLTESNDQHFSADAFLYARCATIAKGQTHFEEILKNPAKLDHEADFEELLTVASEAFSKKTGNPFEYVSIYDYETFSNKVAWNKE